MPETMEIPESLERGTDAYKCSCGGFCEPVDGTREERKKYGCGRNYDCCNVAFVCVICKTRWAGREDAPEAY